jgi:hypothetical protein
MSAPSNLYAEKVFSEHPVALWPLDDVSDYVSLISEENRDLSNWDISNGTADIDTSVLNEPFPQSFTSKVSVDTQFQESTIVSCVSPDLVLMTDLDQSLDTITIGAYVYSNTEFIEGFDIGYEYFDTVGGELVQELTFFPTDISKSWIFISETFNPNYQNTAIRLVIKARFFSGFNSDDYSFFVNGVTFGQWCEEFNSTSLGVYPVSLDTDIFAASNIRGIPAKAYGIQDMSGYYLVRRNSLAAKNTAIPMVYGANNLTSLTKSGSMPSLIVPGLGFLNNSGKHKDYTFEFWLRLSSDASEEKRIFGNVRGNDGLYVRGPFLSLKIGEYTITHYVGKWYRPMLVHVRMSGPSISLVINGEQVGEVFIDRSSLSFPDLTSMAGTVELSNDWLGFYPHEDVTPFEIDCVAIYGYKVPVQVAKKRFVYGQGVEFPENINNSYSGSSIYIDYPFSKYSKNYSYPSIGKWSQASYDNISIDTNEISFPEYPTPLSQFKTKTSSQWLADLKEYQGLNPGVISLCPNSSWVNEQGYLYVPNLSIDSSIPKAIYAIVQELEPSEQKQIIFSVEDSVTQSSFDVEAYSDKIDYVISSFGIRSVIASKPRLYSNEPMIVGVDIQKFSNYFGGKVAQLFGRMSSASIYIGGKPTENSTFKGNIISFGASSKKNLSEISSIFYDDGIVFSDQFVDGNDLSLIADAGTNLSTSAVFDYVYDGGTLGEYANGILFDHTASYQLSAQDLLSGFKVSVGAKSSWQDYIPLSSFAKNVMDSRGDERLDLDFIQFNINYPAPSKFIQETIDGSWTYEELKSEYENPIQRQYDSLDNQLFTGFNNYRDLQYKAQDSYRYDTSASIVKTYVTFQILEDGANRSLSSYENVELVPSSGIVSPDDSWMSTAYEVVDGVIIYPPQSVSFEDIAIVTHIEMSTNSVSDNPVRIRSLEYASLALSDTQPTGIGTRFGNDVYPYRKDGFYFTYKNIVPFQIYKESTPYLYLTRDSGIAVKGQFDPKVNRGISVPVNSSSATDYEVIALQLSMRFDQDVFPFSPTQIFELQGKSSYIRFYMVAADKSGKRARIYAIDQQGKLQNGIAFYLNGAIVREPYITVKEWSMLGIRFAKPLDFSNYSGAFRITGPLTVNNLSHYKSTSLQKVQTSVERPWYKVKISGPLTLDWNYWNAVPFLWGAGDNSVLVISSESYYGVDPSDIYKVYTGTNKIIVDNEVPLLVGDYAYKFYNQVSWRSEVYKPV